MTRILTIIPLCLLAGCTTTLKSSWVDPEAASTKMQDVLVVGMARQEGNRRLFEDLFSERLAAEGVSASASYRVLPQGAEPTHANLEAALAAGDFDTVFVARYVRTDREVVYRQPIRTHYGGGYYFGHHYPFHYDVVTSPGYWAETSTIILQNNLYQVAGGKLIWSAESESFEPTSAEQTVRDLSNVVINDLRAKQLLP